MSDLESSTLKAKIHDALHAVFQAAQRLRDSRAGGPYFDDVWRLLFDAVAAVEQLEEKARNRAKESSGGGDYKPENADYKPSAEPSDAASKASLTKTSEGPSSLTGDVSGGPSETPSDGSLMARSFGGTGDNGGPSETNYSAGLNGSLCECGHALHIENCAACDCARVAGFPRRLVDKPDPWAQLIENLKELSDGWEHAAAYLAEEGNWNAQAYDEIARRLRASLVASVNGLPKSFQALIASLTDLSKSLDATGLTLSEQEDDRSYVYQSTADELRRSLEKQGGR